MNLNEFTSFKRIINLITGFLADTTFTYLKNGVKIL